MPEKYPKVAQYKSVEQFRSRLEELGIDLAVEDQILSANDGSPLADSVKFGTQTLGNRFCIHPMEGWDANRDGSPTELTLRRWRRFGESGAKLIWGGEAAAVRPDGRANPNQTLAMRSNLQGLTQLLNECLTAHQERFGTTDDLCVGLQLTHSGRFCRPNGSALEPRIAYHHPLLDEKYGLDADDQSIVWTDDQLDELVEDYVEAAKVAADAGYQFVDIKACHGYLLHEFLSARVRDGKYGGDCEGRTRLLKTVIGRVQDSCPGMQVVVRLSIFDSPPFATSLEVGRPMDFSKWLPYQFGFGVDPQSPLDIDLSEPVQLLKDLQQAGVVAVNLTCGSPYYNPHLQRPAIFPPSDGYLPPEDPLVGVARHINVTGQCKSQVPELLMVGTGYTYLQDYLPHVGQAAVRAGLVDMIGLGRMVLSYPDLPADVLSDGTMTRKKVCRTFSDCTTAPRNGLPSGCYPLDDTYKKSPEFVQLKAIKKSLS